MFRFTLNRPWAICFSLMGVTLLILGVVLLVMKDEFLEDIISATMVVLPNTQIFPNWKELPVPMMTSIYLFNVTNSEKVTKGAKPILQEVGPFVFKENHTKAKLQWNDGNYTVTYQQIRTYSFVPELTSGSLDDYIITLNPPAASVNAAAKKQPPAIRFLISSALGLINEKLFVRKTIRELLFDGYKDPILTDTQFLPKSIVPKKMDKFGYYYSRNGTDWYDGIFNMYTGEDDLSKRGQLYSWNYTSHTKYFPGECGKVSGGGDFFPPYSQKTYVELFINDLCRPLRLDFDSVTTFKDIKSYVYKITPNLFANASVNPDNWCFNPENPSTPSGVYNASACQFGAPLFTSQPHFYQADPLFLEGVQSGLSPDAKKHETAFVVEPKTGLQLDVTARFQVNFLIEPLSDVSLFKSIRRTFFPTIWFETKVTLEKKMLEQIWFLSNLTTVCAIFGFILLGMGVSVNVVLAIFYCGKYARRDRSDSQNVILNRSLFDESASTEDEN